MSFELMSAAVAVELPCNQKMVLLMLANRTHSDMGYCYPSIKRLAQDCGLSETATKIAMKALVAAGLLLIEGQEKDGTTLTNRYTLLLSANTNEGGRETMGGGRQTPPGGSPDAYKTVRRNSKSNTPPYPPEVEQAFNRFWDAYPRKEAKAKAFEAFRRLGVSEELLQKMLSAISIQRQSEGWTKDAGKYIPHPTTWLNGKRWDDVPASVPSPKFGTDEYFRFHRTQRWWADAGFETVYEAVNAGCHHKNFGEFNSGKRISK